MPQTNISVPASQEEITQEWLEAVLGDLFPGATFASLKGTRIGETFGFASHIFRYQWLNHDELQSVVIKLWDLDGSAGLGEVLFYQTFKDVGTRIPRCFYSAADRMSKRAVLVLEDLSGAIQGDVLEPLDAEPAKGVARSLAKLHTTWLGHPMLAELSWISDVSTWNPEDDWFHARRSLFLERFPGHLGGLARSLLDQIESAPAATNERLKEAPVSLLHGDFHLDNLLFGKLTEPVFLDWSRPLRGAPAYNLATLLFSMTPLKNFDQVFDCYLGEFNKLSRSSLTRASLGRQLGAELLRAFARSTCGIARWQPQSTRGLQLIEAGIEQMNQAIDFWEDYDPELFSFFHSH